MDLNADHLSFVVASYALSGVFLLALTIYVLARDRSQRNEAERLDRQRRKADT